MHHMSTMTQTSTKAALFAALLLVQIESSAGDFSAGSIGEAKPWCSPTDAQATRLEFSAADGRVLVFSLNSPIERAIGSWSIRGGGHIGELSASICTKSLFPCEAIPSGTLFISSNTQGLLQGSWRLTLKSGESSESQFKAKLVTTEKRRCG